MIPGSVTLAPRGYLLHILYVKYQMRYMVCIDQVTWNSLVEITSVPVCLNKHYTLSHKFFLSVKRSQVDVINCMCRIIVEELILAWFE